MDSEQHGGDKPGMLPGRLSRTVSNAPCRKLGGVCHRLVWSMQRCLCEGVPISSDDYRQTQQRPQDGMRVPARAISWATASSLANLGTSSRSMYDARDNKG